jgi:hypothetical protein
MPEEHHVSENLLDLVRAIKPEEIAKRVKVGERPCPFCKTAKATVYKGDPRARGWFRYECPKGHWGDCQTA